MPVFDEHSEMYTEVTVLWMEISGVEMRLAESWCRSARVMHAVAICQYSHVEYTEEYTKAMEFRGKLTKNATFKLISSGCGCS